MKHEFTTCDWCGEIPEKPTKELRIADKLHDMCINCLAIFTEKLTKCGRSAPVPAPVLLPVQYGGGIIGISPSGPFNAGISGNQLLPVSSAGQWIGQDFTNTYIVPPATGTATAAPNGIQTPTYYVTLGPPGTIGV